MRKEEKIWDRAWMDSTGCRMSVEKEVCMWSSRLRLKWTQVFLKKLVFISKIHWCKIKNLIFPSVKRIKSSLQLFFCSL